ncbi:MAG: RidA family protein [Ignavibacterium sp.]|nr:RidA family protein [Melioribacteraceae bacterium]MDD5609878.1 RidA family protein [Ignavibacterium sp.]
MSDRKNYTTKTKWEDLVGYSRAVKVGNQIFISGTTSVDDAGNVIGKNDAYEQTKFILQKIAFVLRDLESSLNDVVRTRMFVTNISDWEKVGKAHGEFFGDIKPTATMIEVNKLINDDLLVEIEVDAITTPKKW